MIETQRAIYKFHKKHKYPYNLPIIANTGIDKISMFILVKLTFIVAKICYFYWKHTGKEKEMFYRFHLISEELAETMDYMNKGNILGICDGFGDLTYVVIGTAVSYKLPAKEIIDEICKSNATKEPRNLKTNIRLRDKGKSYQPPNIKEALIKGLNRIELEENENACN